MVAVEEEEGEEEENVEGASIGGRTGPLFPGRWRWRTTRRHVCGDEMSLCSAPAIRTLWETGDGPSSSSEFRLSHGRNGLAVAASSTSPSSPAITTADAAAAAAMSTPPKPLGNLPAPHSPLGCYLIGSA